jgi:nucleolar protein 4
MENEKTKGEQGGSGSNKKIRLNKIFVKNLSENTTNKDLENFFSDAGPIKRCYAITDKGTQKCRGFGYIHYALEDDAKKAVAMFSGKTLKGNKISVSLSKPRLGKEDAEEEGEKQEEGEEKKDTEVEEKPKPAPKTTPKKSPARPATPASASQDIPATNDPDAIKVHKKKIAIKTLAYRGLPKDCTREEIEKVAGENVKAVQFPVDSHGGAISAYVCYKSVGDAVDILKKYQNYPPAIRGTKIRVELFSDAGLKRYRLIIRNLPFKCYKDEIERIFSKFGKLYEVQLPPGNKEGTIKGFGFVNYLNTVDAKKAIEEGNKIKLRGRQIAVDFTVSKDKYKEFKSNPAAGRGESSDSDSDDSSESISDSDDEENKAENGDEGMNENEDDDAEMNDASDEDDDDEDSDDEDDSDEDEADNGKKQPQRSSDVHMGQTLFLRNLSFDTTEKDVVDRFSEYGDVDYCKLVVDHDTGMPRGTAFLKFKDKSAADLVLETVNDGHDQPLSLTQNQNKKDKKEKKSFTSLFDNPNTIVLDGRPLIVSRAVSRTMAENIVSSEKEVKNKDKRNLFLAPEGEITRESPDAKFFTEFELVNLERAQRDKKLKLANPNFHVSRTRLSLKNLPKDVDEKKLRNIFFEAAKKACPGEKIVIKQAKVVRDDTKLDDKNQPMSRGFGFVEFEDHTHALEALRRVNSMDSKLLGMKQHINVQFAIENTLVLQKRDRRIKDARDLKFTPAQAQDLKRKREEDNKGPKPKKQRTENNNANNANANKPAPKSPNAKNNNNNQNKPKNNQTKGNAPATASKPANKQVAAPAPAPRAQPRDKVFEKMQGVLADSAVKELAPRKQKMFEKQQQQNSRKQQKKTRDDKDEDRLDQLISEREGARPMKKKKKWFM